MKPDKIFDEVASRLDFPDSHYLPRILAELVTRSEAEILVALPANASELAQRLSRDPADVETALQGLVRKGVVVPSSRRSPVRYNLVRNTLQLHDSTGIYPEASSEFRKLWIQWRQTEYYQHCLQWEREPLPPMRTLPLPGSVRGQDGLVPSENLVEIAERARSRAVVPCVCRHLFRACDHPREVCLVFDRAADFALQRGVGRELDLAGVLEMYALAEEVGLVPSNFNRAHVGALCLCCSCSCLFLQPLKAYGYRVLGPSRFLPRVDASVCTGCGLCEERCPVDAVRVVDSGEAKVNEELCLGCGVCVVRCPAQALSMETARPPEFIPAEAGEHARY